MSYNFDQVVSRLGTNSIKWDFPRMFGKPEGLIPLWVADMDFPAPPEVVERIEAAVRHGIFGYSEALPGYFKAVRGWFESNFDFAPEEEWLVKTPGVVFALTAAVNGLTEAGDSVLIQEPVYPPFRGVCETLGRRVTDSPLVLADGRYSFDPEAFERALARSRAKLFILCSPHNPVGRVWSRDELTAMGEICLKHNCLVVADEIHCDFVRPGFKHTAWGALPEKLAANAVICTAPSKSFNLAGLQAANIFIPRAEVRAKFTEAVHRTGYHGLNTLALVAAQAAYELGRPWLNELLKYLEGNLSFVKEAAAALPGVEVVEPEGTYLIWLDFRALNLSPEALDDLLINRAGLWLDEGRRFGRSGEGFYRLNSACPRATLARAFKQLKEALA